MTPDSIIGNIISGAVGGLAVALASHFLTKDREKFRDKQNDEKATANAKESRRREFFDLVDEIKAQIEVSDNPTFWVNYFTDEAVPALFAASKKYCRDLSGIGKDEIETAVFSVTMFSKNSPSEIYGQQYAILEALENLSKL
jgi:hypothetical protein